MFPRRLTVSVKKPTRHRPVSTCWLCLWWLPPIARVWRSPISVRDGLPRCRDRHNIQATEGCRCPVLTDRRKEESILRLGRASWHRKVGCSRAKSAYLKARGVLGFVRYAQGTFQSWMTSAGIGLPAAPVLTVLWSWQGPKASNWSPTSRYGASHRLQVNTMVTKTRNGTAT